MDEKTDRYGETNTLSFIVGGGECWQTVQKYENKYM